MVIKFPIDIMQTCPNHHVVVVVLQLNDETALSQFTVLKSAIKFAFIIRNAVSVHPGFLPSVIVSVSVPSSHKANECVYSQEEPTRLRRARRDNLEARHRAKQRGRQVHARARRDVAELAALARDREVLVDAALGDYGAGLERCLKMVGADLRKDLLVLGRALCTV